MALKLDDDGNIVVNPVTGVTESITGKFLLWQNALCELRCEQGQYFADENYGRSPLVWKLPSGDIDKIEDVKQVVEKHVPVKSISIQNGRMLIEV